MKEPAEDYSDSSREVPAPESATPVPDSEAISQGAEITAVAEEPQVAEATPSVASAETALESDAEIAATEPEAEEEEEVFSVTEDDKEAHAAAVGARWFVCNTYAKNEKVAHDNVKHAGVKLGNDLFIETGLPMQEYEERVGRKKVIKERSKFEGYFLIRIVPDPEVFATILATEGVVGLLGTGKNPKPISDADADRMLERDKNTFTGAADADTIPYHHGDRVVIIAGPFINTPGVVDSVDTQKYQVRVLIPFLGNSTPVFIHPDQLMMESR